MEIALSDDSGAAPVSRLLELRAGLYVAIGIIMIFAAVARPEARLIAVAIILSAALLPSLVPTGHAVHPLEAGILSDILAGAVAWALFPSDPIFGLLITLWGVSLAAFLVDRRNSLALLSLAVTFEVAKVPLAALSASGWLVITEAPPLADVAITSSVGVVALGASYSVFRSVGGFLTRSRSAVARSQARYRSLVESAPTPVLVLCDGIVMYANDAAAELLDEPIARLHGRSVFEWIPDADRETVEQAIDDVAQGADPIVVRDRSLARADGRIAVVDASIAPVQFAGAPAVQVVLIDVTDRHRAESALRVSEERFRTAFLHSATPFALSEMDTSFSQVNIALCELLGYSMDEMSAMRWTDVIDRQDIHELMALGRRAMAGEERTFSADVRMVRRDGSVRWVTLDVATLLDVRGRVSRFVSLAHDITEHRAAQAALAESEERYRSLFERLPVALYRTRPDGTITHGNPALAELLGTRLESLVGGNALEFYMQPEQRRDLKERLVDERVIRNFEAAFRRADGEQIWVRDSSRIVEDQDGIFYEGALVDITARRRIEAALRSRARQQEAIAGLGRLALEGNDTDDVLHSAVRLVVDMLDAAGAAVVAPGDGDYALQSVHGDLLTGAELPASLAAQGAVARSPYIIASRPTLASLAPGLVERGLASAACVTLGSREAPHGYLWAFCEREDRFHNDDATFLLALGNILAAAIDRHRSRSRLEELVRSKDEFIAAVSHELRTPLTVVSGMAHELHDSWSEFGDEERSEFMTMLVDQSRDMSDLIEDLLVAARADIGKVTVSLQRVDVPAEVEHVLSGLKRDVLKRISVDYAEAEVVADPVRFRQIVRNLVTNAIRYGGDDVQVSMAADGNRVALRIADNGPGVAEADRDRIFDAYHRAPANAGQPGSVGLGLTVSRKLAELMGGTLTYLRDDLSVFELSLPAATRQPGSERRPDGAGGSSHVVRV